MLGTFLFLDLGANCSLEKSIELFTVVCMYVCIFVCIFMCIGTYKTGACV